MVFVASDTMYQQTTSKIGVDVPVIVTMTTAFVSNMTLRILRELSKEFSIVWALFYPENVGSKFVWNIGGLQPDYTALHPEKQ